MNEKFHESLITVENRLRKEQGDKYSGFLSISDELANTYINSCRYKENEYFGYKRYLALNIHFLEWLLHNYTQYITPFNIKKTMTLIDGKLRKEKVRVFHKWVGNKLVLEEKRMKKQEMDKLKFDDIKDTKIFYNKMYYNLIKTINKHSGKQIKSVKEELGL